MKFCLVVVLEVGFESLAVEKSDFDRLKGFVSKVAESSLVNCVIKVPKRSALGVDGILGVARVV